MIAGNFYGRSKQIVAYDAYIQARSYAEVMRTDINTMAIHDCKKELLWFLYTLIDGSCMPEECNHWLSQNTSKLFNDAGHFWGQWLHGCLLQPILVTMLLAPIHRLPAKSFM